MFRCIRFLLTDPRPVVTSKLARQRGMGRPRSEARVRSSGAASFRAVEKKGRNRDNREMSFPLPANEAERLRALRSYKILDTKPEARFDELTQLAALICGVPICLISLIDADRQWFKSRVGLDAEETHRAQAFCTHAIMQPDLFVVPDAAQDDRFSHNPLVTGDPHIRFYAGTPLATSDGHLLGTLCVIDRQPRALTENQKTALQILGRQVIANMELSISLQELRDGLEAREKARGPSGDAAAGLDEIIARLQKLVSELQAVREGRTPSP